MIVRKKGRRNSEASGMYTDQVELIFPIGERVGRYRVDALIGVGGMGQVYRAFHLDLEENFALKAIRKDFISSPTAVERFRREAQTAHRLKHNNIVSIDDFNLHQEICYLRMPCLPGRQVNGSRAVSLDQFLKMRGKPLEPEETLKCLADVVQGVSHAHQHGVIHRDLKPSNILFEDEKAMVSDFGLVRIVGEDFLKTRIRLSVYNSQVIVRDTSSGRSKNSSSSDAALVGTYEFMAPETKDGVEADERSDIYALGLIALYMLTGRSTIGIGMPSANFKWIPKEWDEFFQMTLSLDPDGRFASTNEIYEWLDRSPSGRFRRSKRKSLGQRALPRPKRTFAVKALRFVLPLAAVGGVLVGLNYLASKKEAELDSVEQVPVENKVAEEVQTGNFEDPDYNPATPDEYTNVAQAETSQNLPLDVDIQDQETNPVVVNTPILVIPDQEPVVESEVTKVKKPQSIEPYNEPSRTLKISTGALGGVMAFKRVEPGSFLFGSPNDGWRLPQESDQVRKQIEKPLFMGVYEVTRGQYSDLMGRDPSRYSPRDEDMAKPVNNISHDDIENFIKRLNARMVEQGFSNYRARLPNQVEWEYVARSGKSGRFAGLYQVSESGEGLESYACFGSSNGTLPVGSLKPNDWGFYDMYGNIEECTEDGFIRGGSFESPRRQLRSSAVWARGVKFTRNETIGFRVLIEEID